MMTAFDPSIAENYSRVFDDTKPRTVSQDKLRFSEPAHHAPKKVVIKTVQEPVTRINVEQHQLSFSEPLHY